MMGSSDAKGTETLEIDSTLALAQLYWEHTMINWDFKNSFQTLSLQSTVPGNQHNNAPIKKNNAYAACPAVNKLDMGLVRPH